MLLPISAILSLTIALTGGVKVGDSVQYKFRDAVLNGPGLKSLQDLRGTPILIEFWGHN